MTQKRSSDLLSSEAEKPSTVDAYEAWSLKTLKFARNEALKNVTETNVSAILNAAQAHQFFEAVPHTLEEASKKYAEEKNGSLLLSGSAELELEKKTFSSIFEKSFRYNVVWNNRWPKHPKKRPGSGEFSEDWTTPENWYQHFDDLVRGTIVVRYIDGQKFLADELEALAKAVGLESRTEPRALEEGYYSFHFYVQIDATILSPDWQKTSNSVWIEIQITSQMQELARKLSHPFYEKRRIDSNNEKSWKWEFKGDRFKAAYISHSLHLLEGLIVELRDNLASNNDSATETPECRLDDRDVEGVNHENK